MPIYDYRCEKCEELWEENLSMSKMNSPTKKPCPHCEETGCVVKHVGGFPGLATDATLTANKKTGGQWNELMGRSLSTRASSSTSFSSLILFWQLTSISFSTITAVASTLRI